jgi:hypothetical protein
MVTESSKHKKWKYLFNIFVFFFTKYVGLSLIKFCSSKNWTQIFSGYCFEMYIIFSRQGFRIFKLISCKLWKYVIKLGPAKFLHKAKGYLLRTESNWIWCSQELPLLRLMSPIRAFDVTLHLRELPTLGSIHTLHVPIAFCMNFQHTVFLRAEHFYCVIVSWERHKQSIQFRQPRWSVIKMSPYIHFRFLKPHFLTTCAGNRIQYLWICSQNLWPLDHRGDLFLHERCLFYRHVFLFSLYVKLKYPSLSFTE